MNATDFIHDNVCLSDVGFVLCHFEDDGSINISPAGSQLLFTQISIGNGAHKHLVGAEYEECFETSFEICKCDFTSVTVDEYVAIMRWLNRKEFHELRLQAPDWNAVRFFGSFNISKIEIADCLMGFRLDFISNSPFGRQEQQEKVFEISSAGETAIIHDTSDEVGFIYPDYMEVCCKADGDLVIANSLDRRVTSIRGCTYGEVISFDGTVSTLTSSLNRKILNAFNFQFPRIGNTILSSKNEWTFSMPCTVTLRYSPVRKAVF